MTLYKDYAAELAEKIQSGAFSPGQRLPSLRKAAQHRGISLMTVLNAYQYLEARGLVVAKQRSGYFVKATAAAWPAQPEMATPSLRSTAVNKAELIYEVLDHVQKQVVVPLGSAFPSPLLFPLPQLSRAMNRAMRQLDPWRTVADLAPGNAALRQQIALRYDLDGIAISSDELLITDGAIDALNLCLQAVTSPGDTVVIESPTFYVALQALQRLGLHALEVPTDPQNGINLEALTAAITRHKPSACWLMTNFQNPIGALCPDSHKQELVRLLEKHNVPLIEDDVYAELYFTATRPKPAKAFDKTGNVLHCSSFSKCLSPGYRIGWAAAGRYTEKVRQLKLSTSLSAAIPSQLALSEYLSGNHYERHLRQLRQSLFAERDAVIQAIGEYFPTGTRVTRPQGGYFLWVELPKGTDTLKLHRLALAQGISIAPGAMFCANHHFDHCIRLNYGHPENRQVLAALKTLGQLAPKCLATA